MLFWLKIRACSISQELMMSVLAILTLLLIGNWLITTVLVFFPLNLIDRLNSYGTMSLGLILLLFLAWCIGDE
ncbi:MAG: hypothetical protein Tsb0014_05400 [Pleurocapsa sp.]